MQLLKEVVKPLPEWGPALPENRTGRYEEEDPLTPSVFSAGFANFAFSTKTLGLPFHIKQHIFIPTPLSRSRTSVYIGGSRVDLRGAGGSKQGSRMGSRVGSTESLQAVGAAAPSSGQHVLALPVLGFPVPAELITVAAEMQPMGGKKDVVAASPLTGNESNV